ncbi:MAG: RND transporter, partial [Acetobacteraceae bacterium]
MLTRTLVGIVDQCRRHALVVFLAGFVVAGLSGWYAATHMGVSTDTDMMFSAELPWRKRAIAMRKLFPQFQDLIAAVIDARTPEEADATAEALATAAAADTAHFQSVRRPDASPYLRKEGLLLLDLPQLTNLMDKTIDAQPFLGQLVADPSARGLFSALALLGMGVSKSDVDLTPYLSSIRVFHQAIADVLAGKPQPLSWQNLLGSGVSDLAGRYRFVLLQPRLDHGALEPGGAATDRLRQIIAGLEFVRAGTAHVRLTGQVPLADEEFSRVAQGAVEGLIIS